MTLKVYQASGILGKGDFRMLKLSFRVLTGLSCIALFAGCMGAPRVTNPARTAVEQLLLSTAADRAVEGADFKKLAGKKVFLDASGFEATDKGYAIGLFSTLLGKHGAMIAMNKKNAEVIATITSGAFSIDRTNKLIGIPSFAIPIPLTGAAQIPEISFYKKISQTGVAKFAFNAYEKQTGRQLLAIGPTSGKTFYNYHKVLFFFTFRMTDIPEKKKGWLSQP